MLKRSKKKTTLELTYITCYLMNSTIFWYNIMLNFQRRKASKTNSEKQFSKKIDIDEILQEISKIKKFFIFDSLNKFRAFLSKHITLFLHYSFTLLFSLMSNCQASVFSIKINNYLVVLLLILKKKI